MRKSLSTFERKMLDPQFKKAYEESYEALCRSEQVILHSAVGAGLVPARQGALPDNARRK